MKKRLKRIEEKLDLLLEFHKLKGDSVTTQKTIGGGGIKPPKKPKDDNGG